MNMFPETSKGISFALTSVLSIVLQDIEEHGLEGAWEVFCQRNENYIEACEIKSALGVEPDVEELIFRAALMTATVLFATGEIENATKIPKSVPRDDVPGGNENTRQ